MKKILALLVFIVFMASCASESEKTMTVTGKIKGLKKGTLYLQHIPDSTLVTLDSLLIAGDGSFTFTTVLESPELFYLYLDKKDNNDINDRISFFGEPGIITIQTAWNTFDTQAKITGSKSHNTWEEYRKVMSNINKKNMEILMGASQTEQPLDSLEIDSLERLSVRNTQRGYAFAINFALNNKDSYVAPYIAVKEIPEANTKYLDSIARVLTPEVANSKYGKELKALLEGDN
jgi:hypothetical protein